MAAAVTNADTAFTDHSSQSNYPTAKVTHTAFDVDVDFDSRTIAGRVVLSVLASNDVDELVLDTRDLAIEKCVVDGADATFALQADAHPVMGSALTIAFPTPLAAGATASVEVSYKTSPSSSAVQWLRPEQTAGGSHPYLFTQCQAIHARSLYPCQDSPAAKMTYEAKVSAPSALTALMSAIPTGSTPAPGGAKTTYAFEQKVPIPPYLLALAVGDL